MKPIAKSSKLANVCYDIRGPVLEKARQMEEDGHKIIKLNIGNLAVFGLEPPDEIVQDMIRNLSSAAGYTDSKGLFAPRKSVVHYCQEKGIKGVTVDDVYLGNGASELIVMAINALCNEDDEVLLPAPDYPLYTAAVALSGGRPVHYICDEQQEWYPDIADIRAKITPRTKGIVVINPNNPTGALYSDELLRALVQIAREHGLVLLADEVYDKVLYDGERHTAMASLSTDVLTLTFNRPDARNELSRPMNEALQAQLAAAESNPAVKCILLTGQGRAFCAGGDAKDYKARQAPWSHSPQDEMGIFGRGRLLKPVIGAIQGHCLGAGLLLIAMRCDIRIAADNAQFGLPEAAVGIVNCEVGISNQSIPLCALMEMTMTADPIDAHRACALGMVNKVVPASELMAESRKMAERIAKNSPTAIRLSKQILLKAAEVSAEAKRLESELFQISSSSKDAIGGFSAVAGKQKRVW